MELDERPDDGGTRLRAGLAAALKDAIRARDTIAASALRTTLSAIANAEAVGTETHAPAVVGSPHFAGATAGLGAAEVARRQLTAADVDAIVRAEIAEREQAAGQYAANGRSNEAERLQTEAGILTAVIAAVDQR
ncbi:MAG TPA: hypothetical protein VEV63_16310 [Streptosporangiaceae bacterium]|nr:hypothetical protein [Streptosporangiaceae bacterium]